MHRRSSTTCRLAWPGISTSATARSNSNRSVTQRMRRARTPDRATRRERMAPVQVSVLGPVEGRIDGVPLEITAPRLRALLARLPFEGRAPVSTAALVSALWGERPPADEINALQTLVSRLRRVLGDADSVSQYAGGYRLTCGPQDIDAVAFEREASLGRRQLAAGDGTSAVATLDRALRLWRAASPVDL